MDDYIIELEWSDDLRLMQRLCKELFAITPSLVTNLPRTDHFKQIFESRDAYFRSNMWNKINVRKVVDVEEYKDWARLIDKFNLYGDVLFFVTTPEITPVFIPHRHPGEFAGALMLPIIGTGADSITKYAHWHDPEEIKSIDSYNYMKGRPEQTLIPDEEVAVEYCLHEKPAVFNRHQFHQVYNPTEQLRVVAHIVYNTESWQKCKELSLIH